MKSSGLCLSLLAVSLLTASAQIKVEVRQEQQQFLQGEALLVKVRISNHSGQVLRLGTEEGWLTFSIGELDGTVVPTLGEVPVKGEFLLPSSKVAIKEVDLAPYFALSHPGRYSIVATLHLRSWNLDVTSDPKTFDVIEGAKLWEMEVGLPGTAGASNAAPEVRKYMLQQANYLRGQLRLYLRVTDAYGKPLRVCPLGSIVSFGHPDPPQIDKQSNLHVLYQNGATTFSYTAFSPDGQMLLRQVYTYFGSRPRLRMDEDGKVSVVGGVRRIRRYDVPPPKPDELDEEDVLPPETASPAGKPANP